MPQLLEITAVYQGERFRFSNPDGDVIIADGFANSDINGPVTLKGQADLDELKLDQSYRFYGHWTDYKNRRTGETEKQFAFQSFVLQQPHSRDGVINYLIAAGEGKGFGRARANKLVRIGRGEDVPRAAGIDLRPAPRCFHANHD